MQQLGVVKMNIIVHGNHMLFKIILLGTSLVTKRTFELWLNAAFICYMSIH